MLSIFAGAMEGLAGAEKNKLILKDARQRLDQDQETFGINKKIKELEIKKAEFDLDPETIKAEREKLKAETSAKNALYALSLMKIESAEKEENRKAEMHTKEMSLADKILSGGLNLGPGQRIDIGQVTAGQAVNKGGSEFVMPFASARGQKSYTPGSANPSLTDEDLALLDQ